MSIGGHNVLEPMALDVPVFCGPFMQNSKDLCDELTAAQAIQQVHDTQALIQAIGALHQDQEARKAQVMRATKALKANQGSVARHVEAMSEYWD